MEPPEDETEGEGYSQQNSLMYKKSFPQLERGEEYSD
jgi:hypothetical protein